ncbi:hypothetical protein BXZ70DRAFT_1004241 [Cristinia sonorae]|uniref:Uncharacterized protein n=1 Tax=Cristinia sonorae TaxID=1940300 RepID=A0A8K0UVN6_9AGAR|nr:hypothetical protein BXZ70DRAFT_1004241 [Cristinia sonorae]
MASGGPWGGSSYAAPNGPGSSYVPYPPSQPVNDSRRHSIFPQPGFQSSEPGFYTPAVSSSVGGFAPPGPSTFGTSPISSYPPVPFSPPSHRIPAMLQPGNMDRRPPPNTSSRTNSGDLFFQGTTAFPMPRIPQYPPVLQAPHRPVREPRSHLDERPPIPAKPAPRLPPKPQGFFDAPPPLSFPLYPQAVNHNSQSPSPLEVHSVPVTADQRRSPFSGPGHEDEEAFADDIAFRKALELSAQSALETARQRQKTLTQEDEDIARAVQESLRFNSVPMPMPYIPKAAGSSSSASSSPQYPHLPSPPQSMDNHEDAYLGRLSSSPPSDYSQLAEDGALAQQLMDERNPRTSFSSSYGAPSISLTMSPVPQSTLPVPSSSSPSLSPSSHSPVYTPHTDGDTPPMYHDVISPSPSSHGSPPLAHRHSSSHLSPTATSGTPSLVTSGSRPNSRPNSALGRSSSATAALATTTSSQGPADLLSGRHGSLDSAPPHPTGSGGNAPSSGAPSSPSLPDTAPTINGANQYIDQELLRGVSLGFNPPVIRSELTPLQGPIPNVVALPYGRCPPFHLKAPSWRDLLRLMGRLSGTRLEPTIEALAVVKTEMRVRVVVNFVKIHANQSEWHVVLYMTIDQPVPQNYPQKFKYKNGDPNVLPFSYTMSATPAYLREGADAPISKWYNIPATSALPHPKLPISFPDLATYLLDALEESRRAIHDGSSGMRRLAKLIEMCYPADRSGDERTGRERGVGGWVRGLIGRERQRSRDRNEHTYEVVTPFVLNEVEWGR